MAIRLRTIQSQNWTAITSAGQQGTCWIWLNQKGSGGVVISHSDTGNAPGGKHGFKLFIPDQNTNICTLGPDNDNDIFYARNLQKNNINKICVDVI